MASIKVCSPIFKKGQVVLLHTGKFLAPRRCHHEIIRQFSEKTQLITDFTCKEVGIPVPGGTLAGKWWEPKEEDGNQLPAQPPVLCLHGWLDNLGSFDLMLPLMMTPSSRYFCLDFPGHGHTTYCPDWWYDSHMEGILAVRRVVNHFGWDKFSILGHSLGGIVGFLYAAYFPEQVHKLVALENMRPLKAHPNRIDMTRFSINFMLEVEKRMKKPKKTYPSLDDIINKLYEGRYGTISKEGCAILLKRGAVKLNSNAYTFSYNLRTNIPGQEGRTPPDLSLELAQEIESPVCFIKAEPGNVYDTKEGSEQFHDIFKKKLGKKFEIHGVPGTHHFHLNDPHLVAPVALQFLSKNHMSM